MSKLRCIFTLVAVALAALDPGAASGFTANKTEARHARSDFVVISDVDDTIKNTGVTIGRTHLKNIPWILLDPLRPWRPVSGMPELYAAFQKRLNARFVYVSKGPLFNRTRLERALDRYHIPKGEILLNSEFPFAPNDYKFRVISGIIMGSTRRHYVLFGDSGESDPEIYGKLARTFPRQIDRVFIRSVTCDWEGRYRCAFDKVPHRKWEVFAWPQNLTSEMAHD